MNTVPCRLDASPAVMPKSATFSWEFMFARSTFQTLDMIDRHALHDQAAAMFEAGTLRSTVATHLGTICASKLKRAHRMLEEGHTVRKIVLEGF